MTIKDEAKATLGARKEVQDRIRVRSHVEHWQERSDEEANLRCNVDGRGARVQSAENAIFMGDDGEGGL